MAYNNLRSQEYPPSSALTQQQYDANYNQINIGSGNGLAYYNQSLYTPFSSQQFEPLLPPPPLPPSLQLHLDKPIKIETATFNSQKSQMPPPPGDEVEPAIKPPPLPPTSTSATVYCPHILSEPTIAPTTQYRPVQDVPRFPPGGRFLSPALTPVAATLSSAPPLLAPPMPPSFPWTTTVSSTSTCQTKQEQRPQLSFVPVSLESGQLTAMTQNIGQQTENGVSVTIKFLESQGCIDPILPLPLKELFQPLYCKLCALTLSSSVVAIDHYKGKKHKKKIDQWLSENKIRVNLKGPSGANAIPVGIGLERPLIRGSIKPAGSGRPPLGYNGGGPQFNQNNGPQRFPLKRSAPSNSGFFTNKKAKKTSEGGPSYGFCIVCQISLTSQINAEQHYNGKPHKQRVLNGGFQFQEERITGGVYHEQDRTFGIGSSFRKQKLPLDEENGD